MGVTLRNTMVGVPDWSDIAMRTAIEAHMTERLWTTKDLAAAMETSIGSTERWLAGDPSATVFRARLRRYLESLGYPGDQAAIANAARLARVTSNGHHPEPKVEPATSVPLDEPLPGVAAMKTAGLIAVATVVTPGHESTTPAEPEVDETTASNRTETAAEWAAEEAEIDAELAGDVAAAIDIDEWHAFDGEFFPTAPATVPAEWVVPAGFSLVHPPGILIEEGYADVQVNWALRTELDDPWHVLVAIDDRCESLLIAASKRPDFGAMRLGKQGNLSIAVARLLANHDWPTGYRPAELQPDGSWLIHRYDV